MTLADRRVARGQARGAILAAAVALVRRHGLVATSVDEVCATAGVTKGAFFHHFPSKEAMAVAAVDHWSATTGELFAAAAYHELPSASQRVLAYLDLRAALADGAPTDLSCLAGTMAQEAYATSDPIRRACEASILGHAATLEADIAEALRLAGRADDIDAASLARYTQTVIQGAFVLAKATGDAQVVREGIGHLRRYCESLLDPTP